MPRTHEELSAMSAMSPEFRKHITQRPVNLPPGLPDVEIGRAARRAHLDSLLHLMPIPTAIPDIVDEKETFVPATDGFNVPVTIYSPRNSKETASGARLPVIILMHEGGWHLGDRKDEEMNARLFVRDLDCVVLNVEYRLGPEHAFPTGVLDCYSVLQTVCRNPGTFHDRADPTKGIVLGGSSAGGNYAAVLAHKAREEKLDPPVTGQWLSVACLLGEDLCPEKYRSEFVSMTQNTNDPVIKKFDSGRFKGMLEALKIREDDPLFTPFAPSLYPPRKNEADDRPALAKAFFQVGGMDPLKDHSLVYDRALREEWGVETRLVVYSGYGGHMFWTNWPEMEESKIYWSDMIDGMRWLLGQ